MICCMVCGKKVDSVYETGECGDCFNATLQRHGVLPYKMILPELLKAEIPAGDYAWAMKEIQAAAVFLCNMSEIGNEEAEAKIKSFCEAFKLLHYASIMHMKVGELCAGSGHSEAGKDGHRNSEPDNKPDEHTD